MLYLDASALIKRYVPEVGTTEVTEAMGEARSLACSRVGYVETARAVGRVGGEGMLELFQSEWPLFSVVEVDLIVAEEAVSLALAEGLRSLDAIHLAAALSLPNSDLTFATWDTRLHRAARDRGLVLLPESLPA